MKKDNSSTDQAGQDVTQVAAKPAAAKKKVKIAPTGAAALKAPVAKKTKVEKPAKPEQPAKAEKPEKAAKPAQAGKAAKSEKPAKVTKPAKPAKVSTPAKADKIAEPAPQKEPKGAKEDKSTKFLVSMKKSVRKALKKEAADIGVSMNDFIVAAVEAKLGLTPPKAAKKSPKK